MGIHVIVNWIGLAVVGVAMGAAPTSQPTSNPAVPELTARQQNLLMQLSDAEANIQAINKALVRTGYKVGQAYDRIDSSLKGTEQMDRKGGGPVRWDTFYGNTARRFYVPTSVGNFYPRGGGSRVEGHVATGYHPIERPKQFDFIYKANNDQIARAKNQIASLSQDQAALLARRQKHEADQCRMWATLAWEQIKDREITLRPLCRFALKPQGAEAEVLRPVILFLRTADRVAVESLDSVQQNPDGTFQAGSKRMEATFTTVQRSLADALGTGSLSSERRKEGEALKALCKNLAEGCKVIAENHANAMDRDKAKEDNSKLGFRGELQVALTNFAAAVGDLDEEVAGTATGWNVEADKATPTADTVPLAPIVAGKPAAAQLPDDTLQVGTVWVNDKLNFVLTVIARRGDSVRARFEGKGFIRIVLGVVKDGKVTWLAKDVQAVKGGVGQDVTGTVTGDHLDLIGHRGTFTLRLMNDPPGVPQ
jgi:hypothetical protein